MSHQSFPRIETIVVPGVIEKKDIGRFASAIAHELLSDIGLGAFVPRSARLLPTSDARVFNLAFDATSPVRMPESLAVFRVDGGELPEVASEGVAKGDQGKSGKAVAARGAGR
jgi:hypothetical protein